MKFFQDIPGVSRREQRLKQEEEARQRRTGHWAPWVPGTPASLAELRGSRDGWLGDIHSVWTNGWCVALIRTIKAPDAGKVEVEHACITTASQTELSWPEKQKLKNEPCLSGFHPTNL